MNGHKHETDIVEGVIVAECPEGCDISVTLEYEESQENEILRDLKELISECHTCGADMAYMKQEQPKEELD